MSTRFICRGRPFFLDAYILLTFCCGLQHFYRFAGSVAATVAYGRRIESADEWVVKEQLDEVACTILLFVHIAQSLNRGNLDLVSVK